MLSAFLGVALPGLARAEQMWVVASRANLRSKPSADARLVMKLQIGDEVRLLDKNEEWFKVEVDGGAWGWLLGELLWNRKPTLAALRAELAKATDVADRRKWAERAAAVAPDDIEVIRELEKVLVKAGDKRALRRARAAIQTIEEDPFHGRLIGVCDEKGRAVLLASFFDGKLERLIRADKVPDRRANRVTKTKWFGKNAITRTKPRWLRINESQHERLTKRGNNPYKNDSWWKLMVGKCKPKAIFSNEKVSVATLAISAKEEVLEIRTAKKTLKVGPTYRWHKTTRAPKGAFVVVAYDAIEDGAGRHYEVVYVGDDVQRVDVLYDIQMSM